MKRSHLVLVTSVIINIILIVLVVNSHMRITAIEDKFASSEMNDVILHEDLEKELSDLGMNNIGIDQRISLNEYSIGRLEDLIFRQDNIDIQYGVVKGIEVKNGILLTVTPNKLLKGETAIKELMKKEKLKREEAEERLKRQGFVVTNLGTDDVILELDTNCKAYMISEIGLVKVDAESLVEKVSSEVEAKFEDNYTFVLMDNKVVQVYQTYVPLRQ